MTSKMANIVILHQVSLTSRPNRRLVANPSKKRNRISSRKRQRKTTPSQFPTMSIPQTSENLRALPNRPDNLPKQNHLTPEQKQPPLTPKQSLLTPKQPPLTPKKLANVRVIPPLLPQISVRKRIPPQSSKRTWHIPSVSFRSLTMTTS